MDDLGGSWPAVKPSMYICPPFGPAEGPASASRSDCNSSGSSGRASSSLPESTMAPALLPGFTSTVGAVSETWIFCSSTAIVS